MLRIRQLRKSFGAVEVIRGVDLDVQADERHALIGPNGAGKSTIFHLVSGNLKPASGDILLDGQSIVGKPPEAINSLGLARSFQVTNVFPRLTVFENIRLAVMRSFGLRYSFWQLIDRNRAVTRRSEELLERVRLGSHARAQAGAMSYSQQRALEIAMTLASDPKVILLDEPMAGMSREENAHASALIREVTNGRTLLIVEHDMDIVFSLSDRVSVLVYGQVIATGTPEQVRKDPRVQEAYLGAEARA